VIAGNGNLVVSGGLTNAGYVALSAYTNINGTVQNGPSGLVNTAGGTTTFLSNVVNNGTIRTETGAFTVFYGTVSGNGSYTGPGTASFESGVSPGQGPAGISAAIAIGGPANFLATSQLNIGLGGTTAGTQYDQVNVAGNAALAGGSLNVSLLNGFRPAQNDQFTVLTFGSKSGNFSAENGLNLGNRLQLVPAYTANSLTLTAVQGGSGSWRSDQSGNTSLSANWSGGVPSAAGDTATFGSVITQPQTVTVDKPTVLGGVVLDNPQSYTLTGNGANTLTLDNSGNGATVAVNNGSHTIDAPVVLADNVVVNGSGTLTFDGASTITETGASRSLTMNGDGTLILSDVNNYTGGTNVLNGTVAVTTGSAVPDGDVLTIGGGGSYIFDPMASAASYAPASGVVTSSGRVASAVPEPGTIALLLTALCGALVYRRASSRRRPV